MQPKCGLPLRRRNQPRTLHQAAQRPAHAPLVGAALASTAAPWATPRCPFTWPPRTCRRRAIGLARAGAWTRWSCCAPWRPEPAVGTGGAAGYLAATAAGLVPALLCAAQYQR